MKNADRINFYLAGLRQPGEARETPAELPVEAADEAPPAEQPMPIAKTAASSADRAESLAAAMRPAADAQSFAAALREQLADDAGALSATLDQAQLRRLLQRLDRHRERLGLTPGLGLVPDMSPEFTRRRQRRLIFGLLLAAGIIALQATAVIWLYQRAELLLGRPLSPSLLLTATAADLDVVFRPSASAGDIAVLLRELDLRVVDGPDNASRYILRPEAGTDSKRALNALRDRRDLVYSAATAY